VCSSTLPAGVSDRSRETYKYVLYPRQFTLRLIHLTLQSREDLCLRHSISSPSLSRTELSAVLTFIEYIVDQQVNACERYDTRQMYCHSRQPIKDTSFGLAGQSVYAKMSSLQLTELIYCTALVWIPKAKARISTLQVCDLSLNCLEFY
jgi:hypothetical protein